MSWAQPQSNFRHLNRTDGLSSDMILSVNQDTLGFLWVGTPNGLNRYDGVRIRTFYSDLSDSTTLPSNRVNTVHTSRNGDLWLGTHGGLVRFSPLTHTFERISLKGAIREPIIHGIAEDQDGVL